MHKKLLVSLLISAIGTGTLTACNSGTTPSSSSSTSITTNSGHSLKSMETINYVNSEVQALLDAQEPYLPQKLMELIEQIDQLKDEENSPDLQMVYSNILRAINADKFQVFKLPHDFGYLFRHSMEIRKVFEEYDSQPHFEMLNALARALGNINLTTSDNQKQLADAIETLRKELVRPRREYSRLKGSDHDIPDKFYNRAPEVSKYLNYAALNNINMLAPKLQEEIIISVLYSLSPSDDLDIQKAVATKLATINIMNTTNQNIIVRFIWDKKFIDNPEVLKSLITSLSNMNIEDKKVQQSIAECIDKGKFGDNPEVLMNLRNLVFSLDMASPGAQFYMLNAIEKQQLGEFSESEIKSLSSRWIALEAIRKRFPTFFTDDKYFFGNFNTFKTTAPELESLTFGDQKINLSLAPGTIKNLTEYALAFGSFGVVYDRLGKPDLLVIVGEGLAGTNYEKEILVAEGNIMQALGMPTIFGDKNLNKLELIKVFDLKNLKAGFPTIIDNLSSSSPEFKRLPRWLQERVKANEFNINNYKDSNLLQFAMSFAESLPEQTQLKATLVDAIKLVVEAKGGRIVLNANANEDMNLKNAINQEMNSFYGSPEEQQWNLVENKLTEFWGTLQNRESKLKFIYLLGQLAKDGALGYHYDANNQANEFYYYLTIACTNKLIAEDQHDPVASEKSKRSVVTLRDYLTTGGCIQAGTSILADKNKQITSVWDKK
mgnify:CR=1 FL=1